MASFFTASEIAEAAIRIEQRGQEFYKAATAGADDPEVKEFFAFFAGEEARHEQLFTGLRDRLGAAELPAWSTEEEYAHYLRALIDTHAIFLEGAEAEAANLESAIRLAMRFEKDTILFFLEMKELVPDAEKAFVQECIDEERSHLKQLSGMLAKKAE